MFAVNRQLTSVQNMTIILVMSVRKTYELIYDNQVRSYLVAINSKYYSLIRESIVEQLQFEPETVTRNRKPLERPVEMGATWELRFGPLNRFRVFYRVDQAAGQVFILAIGVKERNRLFIAGEEVEL